MKKTKLIVLGVVMGMFVGTLQAAELETQEQRYSYTMGVRLSKLLKSQGVNNLEAAAFSAAISDSINGKPLQMSEQEMTETIKEQQAIARKEREAKAAANLEKGKAFLATNATLEGVKVQESGLQYQVLQAGKGESPSKEDSVKVNYLGTLIDGTKFDSSYDRGQPATFALKGVVPGFSEAISLMKTGAKWRVFLPSDLAYGARGAGQTIGPNETLIFEIELLEVIKADKAAAAVKDDKK